MTLFNNPDIVVEIGRLCNTPVPREIPITSLQACYDCRQNYFTSINYGPNTVYANNGGDIYLLYIPGAREINFVFSPPFSVESKKDDLFVGAGLEFSAAAVRLRSTLGEVYPNSLYYFDNRTIVSGLGTPRPFTITGDSAWVYFRTDRNYVNVGFNLTWSVDRVPPVVTCPRDITRIIEILTGRGTTVFFPEARATDDSGTATLIFRSHSPGSFFPTGSTTVTYIFEDPSGNSASCSFQINVIERDTTPPVVLNCPEVIRGRLGLGNRVSVTWPRIIATDNSGGRVVESCTHQSGDQFPLGLTMVMCDYIDPSGNKASCNFRVLVLIGPIVDCCPADIRRTVPFGQSSLVVTYPLACDIEILGITLVGSTHQSGDLFPVGVTNVTLTFQDADGFQASCSFLIIITAVPVITCPAPVTVTSLPNNVGNIATWDPPTCDAEDGTITTSVCVPASGSFFPGVGANTVTCTCTDSGGLSDECNFPVIIEGDTDPPMLLCPGNIVLTVISGVNSVAISWALPTVSDVSGPVRLVSASHNPGDEFPVGTTTVRYEYADTVGNIASCTFDIRIMTESPCVVNPCQNGGTCVAVDLDRTLCVCPTCFTGEFCQTGVDACSGNMCTSGSTCVPVPGSCEQYTCNCLPCFTGPFCNIAGDVCAGIECSNGGSCQPLLNANPTDCTDYTCMCTACFSGPFCQIRANGCSPNPCQNNARCTDLSATECNAYRCDCVGCYDGFNCERAIPNPCIQNPCLNGGTCTRNLQYCASYTCRCIPGFDGDNCQTRSVVLTNPCNSFPCENGGSCCSQGSDSNYVCVCPPGYAGIYCGMIAAPGADLCLGNPCQNGGSCFASYYSGSSSFMYTPQYMCLCTAGFTGNNCQFNVLALPSQDICSMEPGVCQNGGICANTFNSFTRDVDFKCTNCPSFATGQTCGIIVPGACMSSPCLNSGTCVTESGGFRCICNSAFQGTFCQMARLDLQPPVVSRCPEDFSQLGPSPVIFQPPQATDDSGYVRLLFMSHVPGQVFPIGITAVSYVFGDAAGNQNQCTFYVTITDGGLPFYIVISNCPGNIVAQTNGSSANVMFGTPDAVSRDGRVFLFSQSHTSGSSFPVGTTPVSFIFRDAAGNQAECNFDVTVRRADDCFRVDCFLQFDPVCGSDGVTYSNLCQFEVAQCRNPSLTFTTGVCRDDDPCSTSPCLFGGTCFRTGTGNVFLCLCTPGRSGDRCQIDIENPCSSSPCQNDGTCVVFMNDVFCFCQRGFTGNFCERDLSPCDPNPCQGGGTCFPSSDTTFGCACLPGRTGQRCEGIVVDISPPVVSCGDDIVRQAPISTGGLQVNYVECTATDDSGTTTLVSRSHTPGQFFLIGTTEVTYTFTDPAGNIATGSFNIIVIGGDPCDSDPCLNGGQCFDILNGFFCSCPGGFSGDRCETPPNPCTSNPCQAGGTCTTISVTPGIINIQCTCLAGRTGDFCERVIGQPCDANPCSNGGTCFNVPTLPSGFFCNCPTGFSGDRCQDSPNQGLIVDSALCQNRTETLPQSLSFVRVSIIVPSATFNGIIVPPTSFGGDVISLTTTNYFLGAGRSRFIYNYEFTDGVNGVLTATCDFTILVRPAFQARKRSVDDTEMFAEEVTLCNPNPCLNEGQCHLLLNEDDTTMVPYCECMEGWTGPTCATSVSHVSQFHETVEMWTLLLILVVVVLTFALMVCQYQRRCFQGRQYQDEKVLIQ